MRDLPVLLVLLALSCGPTSAESPAAPESIAFETPVVRLRIGDGGEVVGLIDRGTSRNLVDAAKPVPLATLRGDGAVYPAENASARGDRLFLSFAGHRSAELRITAHRRWFVIEVLTVQSPDATSLDFIDLPLTLQGLPNEPLAACVLALNLKTDVKALPKATSRLQATCHAKLGMVGAKAAIVVCPPSELRDVMKEIVAAADELPHSPIGGPWALDAPANRGSYIIDCTGNTGEKQVDAWIDLLRKLGIHQLDFHCGRCLRFGDLTPHPEVHPRGLASVKAMTDRLHAANMAAGLHTYAFFIAKDSPWVTPVPHRGLGVFRRFTLADAVTAEADRLTVSESTGEISTITGFQIRNSVTLRIDDELIVFRGVRREPPFGFEQCQRGAYGTKAAPHAAEATVAHLKECFGLFVPDPESALWTEVIERAAQTFNEGGFDMIYLDALDGEDILGGPAWGWYYGSKFVFELNARLKRPALFEMSTFHHHLWFVRSRMGAWDAPARGARPFVEIHRLANAECRDMFMPPHLGWWAIFDWQGIQPERTFPETVEYLLTRCLADDCGFSFLAFAQPDELGMRLSRFGTMIKRYEDLRSGGKVLPEMRRQLGEPFAEHTLDLLSSDPTRFQPVRYDRRRIDLAEPSGSAWQVENSFPAQPLAVRIEPLLTAVSYDAPESKVIEDFSKTELFETGGAPCTLTPDAPGARLAVAGRSANLPPWTKIGRKFSPCIDLKDKGLGFWIESDGRGALLNVQVKSPAHAGGGVCDRYVKLDFAGRKYVELIEPESDAIAEHGWPYMPGRSEWTSAHNPGMAAAYPAYHVWVAYDQIEELNLWLNDLQPGGTSCFIGPIKAMPLKPCRLKNPAITIGGRTLTFPTELETGQYLECQSPDDSAIFDAQGRRIRQVNPEGKWPELRSGHNKLTLNTKMPTGQHARAKITVITRGGQVE